VAEKTNGPKFSAGTRVLIRRPEGGNAKQGTIEAAPKTARGKKYLVRYVDGNPLTYRNCPQQLDEALLSPAPSAPLKWHEFEKSLRAPR